MELSIVHLKQLLANSSSLGNQVLDFDENTSITGQGVDSLDMMDFFLNIEDTFNVTIPDTDIEKVRTFNALFAYLQNKVNEV
jgi:acyl carrier protein